MKKNLFRTILALCIILTMVTGTGALAAMNFTSPSAANGRLVISENGSYTLTGSMKGSVYVSPEASDVTLILDNVTIQGGNEAAILAEGSSRVSIQTAEGSVNSLKGGSAADVIQVNNSLDIRGSGSVNISGGSEAGIRVTDGALSLSGGNYTILSQGAAIMADQGYTVNNAGLIALGMRTGSAPAVSETQTTFVQAMNQPLSAGSTVSLMRDDGYCVVSFTSSQAFSSMTISQPGLEEAEYHISCVPGNAYASQTSAARTESAQAAQTEPAVPSFAETDTAPSFEVEDDNAPSFEGQTGTAPSFDGQTGTVPSFDGQTGTVPSFDGQTGTAPSFEGQTGTVPSFDGQTGTTPSFDGSQQGTVPGMSQTTYSSAASAGEIFEGITTNSAASLTADMDSAESIVVSDDNSQVTISSSGTYVISGSSDDGNITVKKGTTGVVLVLDDLDLTSTTGATLSINKNTEVKVIVQGNVTLTDNENPDDEDSEDEEVADAFDGAAIKAKDGSVVYITGNGTLTINGNAKNGIKAGDESSFVIDGGLTLNITAANDGINSNYDLAILDAVVNIEAGDDGIHADRVLTVGNEDGTGPSITITGSVEGMEGTVVNIRGGNIVINSSDDAINAANADALYEGQITYSVNMTGGTVSIHSGADGFDSNGNVNLIAGSATISSASVGGEAGIDYDGQLYISDDFNLNNPSGTFTDGMGGMAPGQTGTAPSFDGQTGTAPSFGGQTGTAPSFDGQTDTAPSFDEGFNR